MRADRLLSMLWLLRTHGGLSTAELARRLEVSRRTVLRDVEALSAAGVPVYCVRGSRGGVRLLPGYRTDVTALTEDESRALFAAISSWGAHEMGLGDAFASGVRKLLAAVPEAHRDQSADMASRIVIDPRGWLPQPDAARPGGAFPAVQRAVFARHRLRLAYRSRSSAATQQLVVEPQGLVSAGGDWYLCALAGEKTRFFKVARIEDATVLAEPCHLPEIDTAAAWREHRSRFLERFTPVGVTGWLRRERFEDAREWAITIADATAPDPCPGAGWSAVRLEFVDRLHAMSVLLRLGPDVRVCTPEEIKTELLDQVDRIARQYQ